MHRYHKSIFVFFSTLSLVESSIRLLQSSRNNPSTTKRELIPRILWVNTITSTGNTNIDKIFEENVSKTIQKYQYAWNTNDPTVINTLSADACKEAISKVPITGASTHLLQYAMEKDPLNSICRIAVLFLYGGYYVHKSIEVIEPYIAPPYISLAAVTNTNSTIFHESFLASAPYNPLLYRALKKYILLSKGEISFKSTSAYGEVMRSSYLEMTTVNPSKKAIIALLSVQDLIELYEQHDEYKVIKEQDGEGAYCNTVIVDHARKRGYFYALVPGINEYCVKVTKNAAIELEKPDSSMLKNESQSSESYDRIKTKKLEPVMEGNEAEVILRNESQSFKPIPIINEKEYTIPNILWVDINHKPGRDSIRDKIFDDNIDDITDKYVNAWKKGTFDVRQLTMGGCKDAILRIQLPHAKDLYEYHTTKDPQRYVCLLAVLHLYGGYYVERSVDVVEPYIQESSNISLAAVINPDNGIFQGSFIAVTRNHPLINKSLQKYIEAAKDGSILNALPVFGKVMQSTYQEMTTADPMSKSSMVLLAAKPIDNIIPQHEEYKKVRRQDGVGRVCNHAIADYTKKKVYFYTIIPGVSDKLCRKSEQTIPQKLWFISRHTLTKAQARKSIQKHQENVQKTVEEYKKAWDVDNIEYEVIDINACLNAISRLPVVKANTKVIDFYKDNKADIFNFCRVVILNEYGGYVFNDEVEVIEPYIVKKNEITFVGVADQSGLFLPAFLAATPQHPITREIIMKYVMLGEGKLQAKHISAPQIYRDAYNAQNNDIKSKSVLLQERNLALLHGEYDVKLKETRICNFIIYDPDQDVLNFFTRIFDHGNYCVDKED